MLLDNLTTYRKRTWSPTKKPLRPPNQRDLEIYKRVRVWGQFQWEVAADLSVHYSRISQIIKRVEAWLAAGGSPNDPKLTSALAERKLSRSLQKLRLQRAVELASIAVHEETKPRVKTRRRIVGTIEAWREISEAEVPTINLFALQNYLAALKALAAFEQNEDQSPTPTTNNEPLSSPDTIRALISLLCRFRLEAEAAGHVAVSQDIPFLVVSTLQCLLGPSSVPSSTTPSNTSAQVPLNLSATPETRKAINPSQPKTSHP